MKKIKYCLDCKKQLGISAPYNDVQRCHSCNTKHLFQIGKLNQSGENHSHYKEGLPHCLDCGKQLCNYSATRCHSCCQKGILHPDLTGNNNGMFGQEHTIETKKLISLALGGTGIPYEKAKYNKVLFNETLKKSIRDRDNYVCQNCNTTEKENIKIYKEKLTIHHIDYNKENCLKENLITVCHVCNTKANINREYWKSVYTNLLEVKERLIIGL